MDGWMDGWQWDVSGQRHKMRTRFKKRFIFPGKKKSCAAFCCSVFEKCIQRSAGRSAKNLTKCLGKKELVEVVEGSLEGETPSG